MRGIFSVSNFEGVAGPAYKVTSPDVDDFTADQDDPQRADPTTRRTEAMASRTRGIARHGAAERALVPAGGIGGGHETHLGESLLKCPQLDTGLTDRTQAFGVDLTVLA